MRGIKLILGIGFLGAISSGVLYYVLIHKGIITLPAKKEEIAVKGNDLILYDKNGFSPAVLIVKKATKVTFVNTLLTGEYKLWPASDLHPIHTSYPGSSIEKCKTAEAPLLFDACREIPPGSVWAFTFNEVGIWGYHNHLFPRHQGTIRVVE